jgi:hypothetical protein
VEALNARVYGEIGPHWDGQDLRDLIADILHMDESSDATAAEQADKVMAVVAPVLASRHARIERQLNTINRLRELRADAETEIDQLRAVVVSEHGEVGPPQAEQAPKEPCVWRERDPEPPLDVSKVRDSHGAVWTRINPAIGRLWTSPTTATQHSWTYIANEGSPLTEVIEDGAP